MKNITSLLLAGIVAMAFAAVADAGTVTKIEAIKTQNTMSPTVYKTNYTYSTSTSSANAGLVKDFGYTSYYSTNAGYMDSYKSTMASSGWSYNGSGFSYDGPRTYRTDYYSKTEQIVTTTETGRVKDVDISHSISYVMQDGILVPVAKTNITETVTITKNINTDTRTTTATVYGWGEPITLDTTNTGKITTARNEWLRHSAFYGEFASKFDFTGDGIPDNCEWVADNPDALLCMPVKGQINGVTELFGDLGGY
ncbi:hypothetical protein IJJ97_02855, partial [bacterium]|nr:hypothetical protein [bacterium]